MYRESTPRFSDEEFRILLESARRGENSALTELWQAVFPRLDREANQRLPESLRSRCNPSDLVQKTYIRFQTRLPTFKDNTFDQLTAWLYRILVNLLIDEIRIPTPGPHEDPEGIIDPGSTPSSGLRRAELQTQVRKCLAQLSEEDQQALELSVFSNLKHKEAAQILEITTDAFAKRFLRAMERMKRGLDDMGIDPSIFGDFG